MVRPGPPSRWCAAVAMAALLAFSAPPTARAEPAPDPLHSPLWDYLRDAMFDGERLTFDERVIVSVPESVEDGRYVPVAVSADGIPDARAILVFADLNPINRAVLVTLDSLRPFLTLRMKVNEATPIRAAVQDAGGLWHLGGTWVDAPGGGCTAPSVTSTVDGWEQHLGEIAGLAVRTADGRDRLRLAISHPMDTGLVDNIPEFHMSHLTVTGASSGALVGDLTVWAAMSANPVLTLEVDHDRVDEAGYRIAAGDNEGNSFSALLPAATRTMPKKGAW